MTDFLKTYHLRYIALSAFLVLCAANITFANEPCKKHEKNYEKCEKNKPYITKEFIVSGPGIFKASTFAGNIEVISVSDTNIVKVEVYVDRGYSFWSGSKNLDNYRVTMEQHGNKILSSVERKSNEKGFFSDRVSFSYKVYMPEKMSVMLKTSAGNISLKGITGNHSIKSYAGNITVENVKGHVQAYTSGGNIDIERTSGTIFGHTNGGNILLDNNKGELRFRSNGGQIIAQRISGTMISQVNGGDIKAQFVHLSKGVSLQTSAGDIYVELPGNASGFNLSLSGTNIEFPSGSDFSGEYDKRRVQGRLFDGGIPISLATGYGKITVRVDKER